MLQSAHRSNSKAWLAVVLAAWAPAALAQQSAQPEEPALRVVRCDPGANSCGTATAPVAKTFTTAGDRAALLAPDLASAEIQLDASANRILIPGCTPAGVGVFDCASQSEYQHCRTLMYSSLVYSCRMDDAFRLLSDVVPIEAAPGQYRLSVESKARLRVDYGRRGFGETRGDADVELVLDPMQYAGTGSCLRRSRMLYRSTGKEGGVPEIDEPADCDEPIEFSFEPHEDDVLRAFELCDSFSSWGEELRDSIEIVAAGLYEMRSTDPGFVARFGAETAVIAPFVTIEAPLTIDCHK